jgi:hypothetical protein
VQDISELGYIRALRHWVFNFSASTIPVSPSTAERPEAAAAFFHAGALKRFRYLFCVHSDAFTVFRKPAMHNRWHALWWSCCCPLTWDDKVCSCKYEKGSLSLSGSW